MGLTWFVLNFVLRHLSNSNACLLSKEMLLWLDRNLSVSQRSEPLKSTIRYQSQGTWALLHRYTLRSIAQPWGQDSRFLQMYGVTLWVFLITCPANSSCLSSLVCSAHLSSLTLGFAWVPPLCPRRNLPPGRKLGDSETSFVCFPSLRDHSSVLPVFQCPKAIASYILSSL